MSKYKQIKTEWKSKEALVNALQTLGYTHEVHETPQRLFGYRGDLRQDTAHIIVRRQHVGGVANDLGFLRDDSTGMYQAIVSEYDSSGHAGTGGFIVQKLKQAYAIEDLKIRARKQGYSVSKVTFKNGRAQLHLTGTK